MEQQNQAYLGTEGVGRLMRRYTARHASVPGVRARMRFGTKGCLPKAVESR